ncbi:type VI secretion system baseplate subunit TssE [Paucibacter sp. B51]|uniref:type VI secretion system baseplate subunit TssE n=1 Tax=Paucibacter sp. B51 TaxID=2993315 RepID=UPI0022EBDC65|nr:type VI secretion system baseplate subunit TssE [Paucibacter sp. B51]
MAQLRARDRLQPALLDRLTDDEPNSSVESADSRVIGRAQLREMVLRDLAWLFNASSPTEHIDWSGAQLARRSVLRFGLPPLSGCSVSNVDLLQLQQNVRQAILDHEPRILPETLVVEAVVSAQQLDHHNQIGFRIAGQLWAQPVPLELLLKTDIDLETGRVAVRELDR